MIDSRHNSQADTSASANCQVKSHNCSCPWAPVKHHQTTNAELNDIRHQRLQCSNSLNFKVVTIQLTRTKKDNTEKWLSRPEQAAIAYRVKSLKPQQGVKDKNQVDKRLQVSRTVYDIYIVDYGVSDVCTSLLFTRDSDDESRDNILNVVEGRIKRIVAAGSAVAGSSGSRIQTSRVQIPDTSAFGINSPFVYLAGRAASWFVLIREVRGVRWEQSQSWGSKPIIKKKYKFL